MLTDIITILTKSYHETGHMGTAVDHMIDSVAGMGHRIKWGHDLEGAINSFHLDGLDGIGNWADHMLKDFTSPQGLPLPFAEAIRNITGMDMHESIDWLCINAADAIEVGGELAVLQLFKEKPKIFKASLVVGTLLGIVDDNPLLIGYNALVTINGLKKRGELPVFDDNSLAFVNRCSRVIGNITAGVAITDIGLGALGLDVADIAGNLVDLVTPDVLETGAHAIDVSSTVADVIDGMATLGLAVLATRGVKKAFDYLNREVKDKYLENRKITKSIMSLRKMLQDKMPPTILVGAITSAKQNGVYKSML